MSDQSLPRVFRVQLDGSDAPDDLLTSIVDIKVENSLHLPDVATIALHDARLRWVDDGRLSPGKEVKLFAAGGAAKRLLFDGEIVEIEPAFTQGTQRLVVRAFDRLHRLMRGRYVRTFLNMTDGDLMQKIAREVGLECELGPMTQVHPYILQSNETNLTLLQHRASVHGYFLYVEGKTLHCSAARPSSPIEMNWGAQLHEFYPRLSTMDQVNNVTVRGWDPQERREVVGQTNKGEGAPRVGDQRGGGEVAHSAFQMEAQQLVTSRPIRNQAEADRLAQSEAARHAERYIMAEGVCAGAPTLGAGKSITVRGVGVRFSGDYYVTAAVHHYSASEGYTTQFTVSGQHPATLLSLLAPHREAAIGAGPVVGIVTDNQDPQGQGRVKVKFPWLSSDHASDWARLVVVGGGADRGVQFLPEVNDEVLVGFELGDLHHPYILGGLWNGADAPPKSSSKIVNGGKVQQRIIQSRNGHFILFDDKDGGGITIQDKNGTQIVLDTAGKSLQITVKGDAHVKTDGDLSLEAQGAIEIKGMGIKIDAGPGQVTIKGSTIDLN